MRTHTTIQLLLTLILLSKEQPTLSTEFHIKHGEVTSISGYYRPGLRLKGNEHIGLKSLNAPVAPTNVSAQATCDGRVVVTWTYADASATCFWLQLCMTGIAACHQAGVGKNTRTFTFQVGLTENTYEFSIWASRGKAAHAVNSTHVTVNVTTFPNVPLMDTAIVSAITASALRITWSTVWKYELRISVCPLEGPKAHCNVRTIDGSKHVYVIAGLNASTLYEVDTAAQVTRYGITCSGPVFEQDVTTFSSDIGPVQNLTHTVVNVTVVSASWDKPAKAEEVDGYTITCMDEASGHSTTAEYHRTGNVSAVLDLKKQLAQFNCSVNAFAKRETGRQEGLATEFEVATEGIAAPRQVTVVNVTKTSLTYSWLVDPNARKYRIHVQAICPDCTASNTTDWLGREVDAVYVEHKVANLTPGTLYEASIQNCADYCGLSTVVHNTTDVDAPSPVRELRSYLEGFSDITLTWARPKISNGPIDGYVIRLLNEEANKTNIHTVHGETMRLCVHLHDYFTKFKASVSAYNTDHAHNLTLFGAEEDIDFETLGKGPFPPLPKVQSIGEGEATLFWKTPHDPRYNITQFCISVNGTTSSFTSGNHYLLDELLPYQQYAVNVSSCSYTVCGEKRTAFFSTDVGAPSIPRHLTAVSLGTSWIDVEWQGPQTPNGPVSGYNITWSGGGHKYTTVTNETMFNVTLLNPGYLYRISVCAFNDGRQRRKHGPTSTINVSTDSQQLPSKGTPTFAIAIVATAFLLVTLAGTVYGTVQIRRRKLAHSVEEFDCRPLVSEEIEPSSRKHILNCWSSSV